jgi:hypothetical protein
MAKRGVGHNSKINRPEDNASKRGYLFQFQIIGRIVKELLRFTGVTVKSVSGDVLTKDNHQRMGPDGGVDAILHYQVKDTAALSRERKKVRGKFGGFGKMT